MSSDLLKYLEAHFKEWDMSDEDREEVHAVCKQTASNLEGVYTMMKKMIEDADFRENVIDIIDQTLQEKQDDNEKET